MSKFNINDILSDASIKETKTSGFRFVDISQIYVNIKNRDRQTIENVEKIRLSIREYGLLNPLKVKANKDNTYTLIAGEGRLRALKQLDEYIFNGIKHSINEIPVMVDGGEYDTDDEEVIIMLANAQKDESLDEKIEITKNALRIFNRKKKERNFKSDESRNKRKWLSMVTGYSESSIRDYLKKIEAKEKDDGEIACEIEEYKQLDKLKKCLEKASRIIKDWPIEDYINEDDFDEIANHYHNIESLMDKCYAIVGNCEDITG